MHRCPARIVPQEAFDVFDYVELLEHGVLPEQGGWLDQAATFTEALAFVLREREAYRKKAQEQ